MDVGEFIIQTEINWCRFAKLWIFLVMLKITVCLKETDSSSASIITGGEILDYAAMLLKLKIMHRVCGGAWNPPANLASYWARSVVRAEKMKNVAAIAGHWFLICR